MRTIKRWTAALLAVLLCLTLAGGAMAESPAKTLLRGARRLFFETDHVTVTGEAVFSLNGEVFKTLRLNYIQEDYRSYYGLQLLTPRGGEERETGWIIIADGPDICVMEAYYPGLYRLGTTEQQNTLVRRTARIEALMSMAEALFAEVASDLPEGAVTVTPGEAGTETAIRLGIGDVPQVANSALTLAALYAGQRFFGIDEDYPADRSAARYGTVTRRILWTACAYALTGADVTATADAEERLTGLRGSADVDAVDGEGAVSHIHVAFDFSAAYGEGHVEPFNPANWGVVSAQDWVSSREGGEAVAPMPDRGTVTALYAVAREAAASQGCPTEEDRYEAEQFTGGTLRIALFEGGGAESCVCCFNAQGTLVTLSDTLTDWLSGEIEPLSGVEAETVDAACEYARAFLAEYDPAIADGIRRFGVQGMHRTEDGLFLEIADPEEWNVLFVVQVEPEMRIVYYSSESNG